MNDRVRVAVAGGGPAGMMLGLLLARSGIETTVFEKHRDFNRDFRGDTVHPSTLDALERLGLLGELLALEPKRETQLSVTVGGETFPGPDLRFVTARHRFLAFVPQWDLLEILARAASRYPNFRLAMEHEVTDVIARDGRIAGIRVRAPEGECDVFADLVVACDGRHSTLRERAGLAVRDFGAPIDVLWFRLERRDGDPSNTFGSIGIGRLLVLIDRRTYWQCGYVIHKGGFEAIRANGIERFREDVRTLAPFLGERSAALDWEHVSLLSVNVDRLRRWWRPGLLCIGDAAHAMSPGGVGINLAIQDAIAAANRLARPLRRGAPSTHDLARVQRRRTLPTAVMQRFQIFAHRRLLSAALSAGGDASLDGAKRALRRFAFLRFAVGQLIGVGVRPERVR